MRGDILALAATVAAGILALAIIARLWQIQSSHEVRMDRTEEWDGWQAGRKEGGEG